ncbi:MAG: hypothetical protein F6K26_47710 [Moorea sp. SIO2I5]|nr:hypothetical protein [Moorena sp. SIO2I5]
MAEEKYSQQVNFNVDKMYDNQVVVNAEKDTTLNQNKQICTTEPSQPLNKDKVVELITQLEELCRSSYLPEAETSQAIKYLEAAKEEAQEEEPDKDFAAKNLQKACTALKGLKEAGETVEAGKNLWETFQLIITKLLPWFGKAANFFI